LSIAIHCSTNVLKLMCLLFPDWGLWGARSCSLPVDVPAEVDSSIDKLDSADSLDSTRGGESFLRALRGVRTLRMWVSLLVCVRNGRLGGGGAVDDGCSSCDAGGSSVGGSLASNCGEGGRQRISVMLRCLRIGFVNDPFVQAWVKAGLVAISGLGRGSQSEPGCSGP
jgi:hypothetical protein